MNALLGVLGGMGPLATVDFLEKLIAETPATRDAEHIPLVVYSVPQIPDRPKAILENGESPLPAMLKGIRTLKQAGATCIAIPCNTAHYWYDDLVRGGGLPILHIADAACAALTRLDLAGGAVGLIATKGTLAAGIYQQRLEARGYRCIANTAADLDELVLPAITHVKSNALDAAHALAVRAARNLRAAGAQAVILACTEIPLALEHQGSDIAAFCVDPTRALAQECVRWWQSTAGA
jgi:aspartate racemase